MQFRRMLIKIRDNALSHLLVCYAPWNTEALRLLRHNRFVERPTLANTCHWRSYGSLQDSNSRPVRTPWRGPRRWMLQRRSLSEPSLGWFSFEIPVSPPLPTLALAPRP